MLHDPLEFVSRAIARDLSERWEPRLEEELRGHIAHGRYTDALLVAQELHDRIEHGLRGELAVTPGRIGRAHISRRAAMIRRILNGAPERAPAIGTGQDRRETPGGSGGGLRAEDRLRRLTDPAGSTPAEPKERSA